MDENGQARLAGESLPPLIRRFLSIMAAPADRDAILGDFEEEFRRRIHSDAVGRARRWLLLEMLLSLPPLFQRRLLSILWRLGAMNLTLLRTNPLRSGLLGLLALLPAFMVGTGGILHTAVGPNATSEGLLLLGNPFLVLGGIAVALAVNLLTTVTIATERSEARGWEVRIGLQGKALNVAVITLAGLLSALIFAYLLVENFQIISRYSF